MFGLGSPTRYPLGQRAILSYRGAHYEAALRVKEWLEGHGACEQVVLFPPNSLCAPGELLLPYEYIELMEVILDHLARCQSFVFLDTPDYQDSYFTQAEMLQWRRFRPDPVAVPAGVDARGRPWTGEPRRWEPLSENEKKLWAKISVGINRKMQGPRTPASAWGRFAKNCFLTPCERCGEHLLVTQTAVYAALKGQFRVICPHCSYDRFVFVEGRHLGNYYRKPVSLALQLDPARRAPLRVLRDDEILALLVQNETPRAIPMVGLEGENPWSDLKKILVTYGALTVAAAGAFGLAAWLGGDRSEREEERERTG